MPASGTTGGDGPSPPGAPPGGISEPRRPGVPSRLTAALLFTGTVLGGLLGAGIGWGLVDVGCRGDCTLPLVIGIVVGGAVGAGGVGVVAVLVLRAMNEWRLPHAAARGRPEAFPLIERAEPEPLRRDPTPGTGADATEGTDPDEQP